MNPRLSRDAQCLEPDTVGPRTAADGDKDGIRLDRLGAGVAAFKRDRGLRALARDRCLTAKLECQPLALQQALRRLGDLAVSAGQDTVEVFHDRHLRAEPGPDLAQFQPDHPGADHLAVAGALRRGSS
jgi:hypothetical protein